jgi:hypothetical protein
MSPKGFSLMVSKPQSPSGDEKALIEEFRQAGIPVQIVKIPLVASPIQRNMELLITIATE